MWQPDETVIDKAEKCGKPEQQGTDFLPLLIGNTAENVLNQVNCSVLTVKPEGFVTPVKLDE